VPFLSNQFLASFARSGAEHLEDRLHVRPLDHRLHCLWVTLPDSPAQFRCNGSAADYSNRYSVPDASPRFSREYKANAGIGSRSVVWIRASDGPVDEPTDGESKEDDQ
jgi:hypothetical protein